MYTHAGIVTLLEAEHRPGCAAVDDKGLHAHACRAVLLLRDVKVILHHALPRCGLGSLAGITAQRGDVGKSYKSTGE
jgi:hypothetical protein